MLSGDTQKKWEQLSEKVNSNLKALRQNNELRIEAIRRYGTPGSWKVFQLVPILLQINNSYVPGYIEQTSERVVPRGIYGFEQSHQVELARRIFPRLEGEFVRSVSTSNPAVESLLLMGSSGSVGYTAASDLDYWVCIDPVRYSEDQWEQYHKKLASISHWADKAHSTEVNFYVVTMEDLAANRFERHGEETEGEVAPYMLKEEFYRTLLHVAGRTPLWWLTPPGVDRKKYGLWKKNLPRLSGLDPDDFIDLGFPGRPDPQEFMAAALWLSRKSEADPFKGALKMILVLEQVETGFKAPLLCESVKKEALTRPMENLPVDPYMLMIERVLSYAVEKLDPKSLDLIRLSAFYKVKGALGPKTTGVDTPKTLFLNYLVKEWGWDEQRLAHNNNYQSWPPRDRLALGQEIKSLLFDLYSRISKRLLADYPDQVSADDQSLAQFKARILARYSAHRDTVEALPSSLHHKTLPKSLTMVFQRYRWELYAGRVEAAQSDSEESLGQMIYTAPRAARMAAWLVYNTFFTQALKLRLRPRPGPVGLEAMWHLMETITELFPPPKPEELESEEAWRLGGGGPRLLVVNLEVPWHVKPIKTVDLIYRTAWGEMRHTYLPLPEETPEAKKLKAIVDHLTRTGHATPQDVHLFVPSESSRRKIEQNIRAAVFQTLSSGSRKPPGPGKAVRKIRLDTD